MRHAPPSALVAACLLVASADGFAAEGMWTLDNLPTGALEQRYGFSPDAAWVDRVMKSSVRLAGGCSGSFVSPQGLVMTNHHCVVDCVSQLSTAENDLIANGFVAREPSQEKVCGDFELNRLEQITDVTERIRRATEGLSGERFAAARKAEQAKIESECVGDAGKRVRCDVVDLYQGGLQHLYRYTRFQDVRLVFAPEFASGFFGGDPDNFNFPRYNFDFALLRAYEDDKPVAVENWFPFDPQGADAGELVMVTGHPGATQRLLTVEQLQTQRDLVLLTRLEYFSELRGLLTRFSDEDAEQARIARTDLFGIENALKVYHGRMQALLDPAVFERKQAEQDALRAFVAADPGRKARYGGAWEAIAKAQQTYRDLFLRYELLENGRGFQSEYFTLARQLVRAAEERGKPNGERLEEFTDAALPRVEQQTLAEVPIYPEYEKVKLGWSLTKLRALLGADHPFVRDVLGKDSPQQLADRLVEGTTLGSVDVRRALWEGGLEAIVQSDDPMIALARRIDDAARAVRERYENEVEAVVEKNAELLAAARFAKEGTGVYPDATFTLRLSYGEIRGWTEHGDEVPPFTQLSGLYERATGADPYRLAPRWAQAKDEVDLSTRMNQVSTNDIIGGNSGSPLIDRDARIVGLIFDGNIHSLGGNYFYDESMNRAVSVHSALILEALRKVYGAGVLADEMLGQE